MPPPVAALLAVERETLMISAFLSVMIAGVMVAVAAFVLLNRERGRRLTWLGWEDEKHDRDDWSPSIRHERPGKHRARRVRARY